MECCYAEPEKLKDRTFIHYKASTSGDMVEKIWYNDEDYFACSGGTQLLVYEGPIGWDETRK